MQDSSLQTENATAGSSAISAPASNRAALLIVFLVVFIDLLGFGIILPLLPRFADSYLGELISGGKDAAMGGVILGLLMSSFSFMQYLFAPIWGRLSDRVGRRPILLLGLFGSVLFYTLFGYASSLPTADAALAMLLLFASRIGAGIAGATISTAQAVIADSTPPDKRKHGMAMIGAAFGIGFTFGPLIGFGALQIFRDSSGSLHHEQLGVVGYVAAGLSLIALLLGFKMLPETRKAGESSGLPQRSKLRGFFKAFALPSVGPVILVFFLATMGFGMFEPTLALLVRDALGLSEDDSFLVFSYVGLILVLAQGFLYRRLAKHVSEIAFMTMGILLMALGLGLLGYFTWHADPETALGSGSMMTLFLVSLAVAVIGFALLTPSANALVSRRTDASQQGEILGVNQSASAMARILGPFLGLVLYKLDPSHLLPYGVGAVLVILMLPLLPRISRG